jgi:uncharacterized protein (DUF697 family)
MTDSPRARLSRRPVRPGRRPASAPLHRAQDVPLIAERCRRLVTRRALLSAGASVVPLPGFDLMVDLGVLTRILHEVNAEFGLTPQQIEALSPARQYTVYKAINALGASAVGRLITREVVALFARSVARRLATKSVLRFVPLAGTALAASISFVALKTLGDRHVADCARVAASAARAS